MLPPLHVNAGITCGFVNSINDVSGQIIPQVRALLRSRQVARMRPRNRKPSHRGCSLPGAAACPLGHYLQTKQSLRLSSSGTKEGDGSSCSVCVDAVRWRTVDWSVVHYCFGEFSNCLWKAAIWTYKGVFETWCIVVVVVGVPALPQQWESLNKPSCETCRYVHSCPRVSTSLR